MFSCFLVSLCDFFSIFTLQSFLFSFSLSFVLDFFNISIFPISFNFLFFSRLFSHFPLFFYVSSSVSATSESFFATKTYTSSFILEFFSHIFPNTFHPNTSVYSDFLMGSLFPLKLTLYLGGLSASLLSYLH